MAGKCNQHVLDSFFFDLTECSLLRLIYFPEISYFHFELHLL